MEYVSKSDQTPYQQTQIAVPYASDGTCIWLDQPGTPADVGRGRHVGQLPTAVRAQV